MPAPDFLHLHTYFLFPFSVDRAVVSANHPEIWARREHWIEGLDEWIAAHRRRDASPLAAALGPWRRCSYRRFDVGGRAYQDMVFFHPFVRRVFFDVGDEAGMAGETESLLRAYSIPTEEHGRLCLSAGDAKGLATEVAVSDLRLFLFANGIGILSIGVEASRIPAAEALWVNESLRKVYPSSDRQVREGRVPNRIAFTLDRGKGPETLLEERFETCAMNALLPPLAGTITSLIYFADYPRGEYEPVLDERMIVYTCCTLDPAGMPEGYLESEEYEALLSRLLYVDRAGPSFRYDRGFVREQMRQQMYRRWAHQGTWYGATSYSNITAAVGAFDCDDHQLREGFLIHRMFDTRYYLMALVALFYRATLLSFNERTALVSKRLFLDHEDGRLSLENIRAANALRAEFLHFSNYWFFDELANKDEELEHFALQCRQYRIETMKNEIESELEKLDASLHNYNQMRNTEAVNRLAMLSLIFGAGAVLTGFFGMNFGRNFEKIFFQPDSGSMAVHYGAIAAVALLAFGALALGFHVVAANWPDYRDIFRRGRK